MARFEVHLQRDGMSGCYGGGETVEEAVREARAEYRETFGGKPKRWAAVVPGGAVKPREFTNWKQLEESLKDSANVLKPCCSDPMLRGGRCCNCGTWMDDPK